MKVKSESEFAQSCPILCNPVDWSLPGSSVLEIFQTRVLDWIAISFIIIIKKVSVCFLHIFRFYSIDLKSQSDYLILEFLFLFEVLNFL